ncbi:MAG: S-layer homology domain-containing protein [Anaerovorax sp.]|nr:S-layer homology domain-containing protein [Anaerovorax sp.]
MTKNIKKALISLLMTFIMVISLIPFVSTTVFAYETGGTDRASATTVTVGSTEVYTRVAPRYYKFIAPNTATYTISTSDSAGYPNTDIFSNIYEGEMFIAGDDNDDYMGHITYTASLIKDTVYYIDVQNCSFNDQTCMLNISVATIPPTLTAPTFKDEGVGSLIVSANAKATDIKNLIHVSDTDAGQTLIWTQADVPDHGTLSSFEGATASSGSTDITPGGTLTYTPAPGYSGLDSFVVQVSDGTDTATRTINVTVNSTTGIVIEHFSDEVINTTNFTNNGFSFNLTGGHFNVANVPTYGWTGTEQDDFYVDNYSSLIPSAGIVGSIQITSGTFRAHSIYVFPGNTGDYVSNEGTVIVRGKLADDTKFTKTISESDIITNINPYNGFTYVDLSEYNAIAINTLEFELTGNLRYLAIDAFKHESTDLPALPSSNATLKASSTVKGQTVASLGTPNAALGSETAGSVTITAAKAADTSNTGSFITLFEKNDINATVKAVKYASGVSTANFETDAAYANEAITDGDFFIIKVTAQDTTTVNYYRVNVTVTPAVLVIDTTNPSAGTVGTAYAGHTFTATGGTGLKTYAVTSGTLPTGLALASNGTLSGTPTASGSFTFTVTVTDSASTPVTDSHSYSMTINPAVLVIDTTNPSAGTVGTAYAGHTFTATGGTGSKTYAVTSGTLPTGLALASNGTLSGTPTASGSFTFTVTVTDSASTPVTDSHSFTISVDVAISSDATLKSSSTVKGQTVSSLGTPNLTLGSETAGSVTITAAKAADTSNAGSFITLFDKNDTNATLKVVKYASGASTANFETDSVYANEALTNGNFFIIKVTAQDTTTVNYYRMNVTVNPAPSSGGNGGGSSTKTPQTDQDKTIVIVNGIEQDAGKETKITEDGKSTIIIEVDNKVIESKINEVIKNNIIGTSNLIQVPVADTKSEVAKVELTGEIVKRLEENAFDVSVKRDDVEYVIPAEEFTISKVAENLGIAETDLEDIKVEVKITKLDNKVIEKYKEVAKSNNAELVFPPVSFEVVAKTIKADGTTGKIAISKFSNYVERVLEIPDGVDPSKITTGIVFNPDGTYSHIPTEAFQKDGKWYVKLNSLTNSEYSVIWNPVTVKSVEKHWAKNAVNDMASRLVIFNPESFVPDKAITRADYAEYIIRSLGLYREGSTHVNKFKDVSTSSDRTLAILIASEYGIVTGYTDGTFKPDALITREEAMAMYQRSMKVTKLVGNDMNRYQSYTDFTKVSGWASTSVKEVLAAHVFNGTSATTISPKSNLTYAEAVQAIKNLLVESKLINK